MDAIRRFAAIAAAVSLLFTSLAGCRKNGGGLSFVGDSAGYLCAADAPGTVRLTNGIDGYSLCLPDGAQVDASLAAVRTAVSYGDVRLYVYAQEAAGDEAQDGYINYSNTFLTGGWGVTPGESGQAELGGCEAVYNTWVRKPFSRVENDKPNYACFDIKGADKVYTLMFKYGSEADYAADILPVAESFAAAEVTASAPEIRFDGDGPALDSGARKAYNEIFGEKSPLTWGVFVPDINKPGKARALEEQVDFDFDIYLLYSGLNLTADGKPSLFGERLYDILTRTCPKGKIPELTLQTFAYEDKPGLMIYDVLNGEYDGLLHDYAKDVAAFARPVLLRPCNEMNGDWCPYNGYFTCRDPDIYVDFYRYIFDIFQQEGAHNAIWVFNPNGVSFPKFKWNSELVYYPGSEYVNVVGMTAYNTGTYYEHESWSTFDQLYSGLYADYTARYARPLMITEFACSGIGGDKAAWIDDMFRRLPDYPQIKAAVWWNSHDLDAADPENPVVSRPYELNETEASTAAFRRGIAAYKN